VKRRRGPSSLVALTWRQIRTSTIVMLLFALFVVEAGVASFNASGGAKGMASLTSMLKDPAIIVLYGKADSLSSGGALIAWKMGEFLALAVACWAALLATRLVRGAEDDGTWDVVVAGPTGRHAALRVVTGVLAVVGFVLGLVLTLSLLARHQRIGDSVLYGAAMTGVAWFGSSIGLLASQVSSPRRSASQFALGFIGIEFLARMFANVSTRAGWLSGVTPFGWLENVGAFQHRDLSWAPPLVLVPVVVVAMTWWLERRRDVGVAVLTRADRVRARELLLVTPLRFAWRERRVTFFSWMVGLSLFGLTFGSLTNVLVSFGQSDPSGLRLLTRWGFGSMVSIRGFMGEVGTVAGVLLGFFVVTLVTVLGTDSMSGRLELPLSYGVARWRWFTSALVITVACVVVVTLVCGASLWIGAEASGASMHVGDPLRTAFNAAGPSMLLLGLSALLATYFARATFVVMAAIIGASYLLSVLGPALHWPHWVVDISPFHYLRLVPATPPDWGAYLVFLVLGILGAALGLARFTTGDLAT